VNEGGKGRLFVVATPIGNLEDLTPRARRVLAEVDQVAAEDTRRTRKLVNHLGIKVRLVSYHEHNQAAAGKRIMAALRQGRDVALVTDAGTPAVSDPGPDLVRQALAAGLEVVPIPGPSAVAAALSVSGLGADRFLFAGFPPAKLGARREFFRLLAGREETLVFFEAPHRLAASLREMARVMGERQVVLGRELTKLHEEVRRATVEELARWAEARELKGEVTLVVAGAARTRPAVDHETLAQAWREAREKGLSASQAAKELAKELGLSRGEIYQTGLVLEKDPADEGHPAGPGKGAPAGDGGKTLSRTLTLTNSRGLHARAATRIIQHLQAYPCRAYFAKDGQTVEGDSILSLLTLNCPRGSKVEVRVEGEGAAACLEGLGRLFARNFDEE